MTRARFMPLFLASFVVTLSLLAPGALRDGETGPPAPVAAIRA